MRRRRTATAAAAAAAVVVAVVAVIAVLAFLAGNAAWAQDDTKVAAKAKETATQAGNVITIQPAGLSFRIPDSWLTWQKQFKNNVHVTAEELAAVKDGAGEWDTEFGEVVNALLPFEGCVAAGGGEGWGKNAVSFVDVQMRVYLVEDSVKAVGERAVKDAPDAVRKLFTPRRVQERNSHGEQKGGVKAVPPNADVVPADMKVPVLQDELNGWARSAFAYRLHYGDYGGTAKVDVCARQFGERTVVVVFMYSEGVRNPKEMNGILDSFALAKGATN